jgi:hypothetical protein
MDENLIGYYLRLHDDETQLRLDAELRSPEGQQRLERVQRALAPLDLDRSNAEPPGDLTARTLSRVAEFQRRPLPRPSGSMPRPLWTERESVIGPSRWRRPDALVAACLLVLFGGLSLSGLTRLQHRHEIEGCQDNLRRFHQALVGYSQDHDGRFPQIEETPPLNRAGAFVSMLQTDGRLSPGIHTSCPAVVSAPMTRASAPQSPRQGSAGAYAYSLGYRDPNGELRGLRLNGPEADLMPIMADRPPPLRNPEQASPNHGTGQNVLFIGGHVRYCTNPRVGVEGDDIFLNDHAEVAAGLHRLDTVLGAGHDRP